MSSKLFLISGALINALGVILGAFGAHFLKSRLHIDELVTYETAIRYLFIHAMALIIISLLIKDLTNFSFKIAGVFFLVGIALFSGSLLMLIATKIHALGAITPMGGLCFIIGWLMLAIGSFKTN